MLSTKVKNGLNDQIQKEHYASIAYLSLATWCEEKNLDGIAEYFYAASEDERSHMLEIYKYLNTYGGSASIKNTKEVTISQKNLLDVFKYVFDLEHEVTLSINKLAIPVASLLVVGKSIALTALKSSKSCWVKYSVTFAVAVEAFVAGVTS